MYSKFDNGDQIMEDELRVACSTHEEKINSYTLLIGGHEDKGPRERQTYM